MIFPEMKIDKAPFPVHTIDLNNAKVLIWPDQAEGAKGKNVIIGDERPLTVENKILARKVIQEKAPDRKKIFRIILKPRTLGEQKSSSSGDRSAAQPRPIRPISPTGQTGPGGRSDRPSGQPRSLSVRKWVRGRLISQRCRAS